MASKRRNVGDVVKKRAGAGFVGEPLIVCILEYRDEERPLAKSYEHCILGCGDPHCKEWIVCKEVSTERYVYHVSECEMEDV